MRSCGGDLEIHVESLEIHNELRLKKSKALKKFEY
jgi:hypothetical protein